jgi:hypothetical protein
MSSSFGARPWHPPDELDPPDDEPLPEPPDDAPDDELAPELEDARPPELDDDEGPPELVDPLPAELEEPLAELELPPPDEPGPTPEEPMPLLPPELSEPGPAPELEVPPPSSPAVRPPQPPTMAKAAADSAPASAIDAPYTGVAAFVFTLPSEEPLGWRVLPITPRDARALGRRPLPGHRRRGRYLMCASLAGASPATSVGAR